MTPKTQMKPVAIVAGHVLMLIALLEAWDLGSAPIVGAVALVTAALTVVLFADFSRFKASGPGGFGMEAERYAAKVEEAVAEVVASGDAKGPGADTVTAEADRSNAIERVIAEAAEWGWTLAQRGSPDVPRPRLEWLDDGRPRLVIDSFSEKTGSPTSV